MATFDITKIDVDKIIDKANNTVSTRVAKYSEEFNAMKEVLFNYAEDNKGNFTMSKLRYIASGILVEFGSVKEAYTDKPITIKGKKSTAKEYAVTAEQLRSLFKKNAKEDLLPAKRTRK
ncbi:hypothetical protein HUE87_03990 [Candidatus Sulfurimonas marisnigri]|uniref:Uncharacterized protein n=1 Tax=Candidatus Sulfurimonas marisnigri TaxID=2740405 RepID=A0A7S7RR57_9BACT|nr:hypothetical protein [Candidatus Sulfurimonas marisnigri]QOY55406.1 hypothetical protein HUE87_03990 [Candidatus Sulfurimonas marisnigri]